jgi:uncharacterized protein YrrD
MEVWMDIGKLKGMAIVSVTEGSRLGRVEDVLIDTSGLQIGALKIAHDGQQFMIPFNLIKNVGSDAITVESSQVTQAEGSASGVLVGLRDFKKLKMVDEAGTLLGVLSSVDFDQKTGKLLQLSVHKGGMLGLGGTTTVVDTSQVRGIGREVVTVSAEAAAVVQQES